MLGSALQTLSASSVTRCLSRSQVSVAAFAVSTARRSSCTSTTHSHRRSFLQPQASALYSAAPAAALGSFSSRPAARLSGRTMATGTGVNPGPGQEVAVLGGGCFWCLEACYQQLKGVSSVVSGYAGGHVENPTYRQVCDKGTGHAEVVAVTFDPTVVTFRDLLDVFFTIHDPTTPNRQGADVGPQYRSIILYTSDEQRRVAEEAMAEVAKQGLYPNPLVTELVPLGSGADRFWAGEDYHQNYYADNPSQGYCRAVVAPKVSKFRSKYMSKLMA